jgi:drug/metabolite transporter (DMT)-like permease
MNSKNTGILAILAAAVMWAIEPVLAKLAYANSDFLQTSAIRAIVVTFIATLYVAVTNKGNLKVSKKQFSTMAYIAIVGTLFADLMYFYALTKIEVLNAVLIGHMQPIFIILIGFVFLKEDKLAKHDYLGIALMIIAGLFVTTKTPENLLQIRLVTTADMLVLLATVAWATTAIAMRKYIKDINAGVVTFYRYLIASTVFAAYFLCSSSVIILNIYQVLVGVVVGAGTILYYESLKRIKAAQVGAFELSTPLFAAIFAFLVLRETVTIMQVSGIALMLAGVYNLSRKEEAYF